MELRQLEYVVAVVDHGSFTAGAEAVGVAQPSLSEGIRKLESELGVQLFHRIGRRVSLTQAGHAFEGPARRLLRDRVQVLEAVDSVRALDSGTLDVVALATLAVDPLAALVGRFRRAHPGIVVHISEPSDVDAIDAVEAMIADGRAEIGLAELPSGRDDLVAIKLARQEIVAVCPPDTLLASPGRLPVAALKSMPLVAPPRGASTRDLLERALASAAVEAKIAVETAHREAIGPLVLGGAGTSFLPRGLADALGEQGAVVAKLVPAVTRTIGLLHRASPLTPAARAFVELARARL
jgi:LysR family transcriptional regulator, carnitine catabolism transcriptional activator